MKNKPGSFSRAVYLVGAGVPISIALAYLWDALYRRKRTSKDLRRDFETQIAGMEFTTRWFLGKIDMWEQVFSETGLAGKDRLRGLEVGSWEGMSALYLLRRFPSLELTCIDTWSGGDEHATRYGNKLSELEQRFDRNTREFSQRLNKFRGTSASFFLQADPRETFDLIYIDGSHYANDVIIDAVCAFDLLNVGGVMIFDDFTWAKYSYPRNNPAMAIAAFLMMKKGLYRIVRVSRQVIIQKTRQGGRDL
jgi:predicted O-methyltransferase YrrM